MRNVVLLLALVSVAGCFSPDEPVCAFRCGDNNLCPDDYQCNSDGYCHLHGQPGDCNFPDASAAPIDGGDMTMPPGDLSPDLAGFSQFLKCNLPSSYLRQTSGVTITFGNSLSATYSVPCAQLSLQGDGGASVTVNWAPATGGTQDFSTHPLTPSTLGSTPNPIPLTASAAGPATATFTTPGFYPYYAGDLGANDTSGMAGVVWITP